MSRRVYFIAIALLLANPFYNIIAEDKPSNDESQQTQKQGPREKKIEEYHQKLASNPNDIELHRAYQNFMRQWGGINNLREEYLLKLAAEPQNPLYFYLYGRLVEGKELEDSFKRAMALEAKTPNTELRFWLYFGFGQFYLDTKKYKESLQHLEMASKLKPDSLDALHQMALVYYEMDNITAAMKIWDNILQAKKDYSDAMLGKALIYKSRGMYDNAIKELENILRADVTFWRTYEPLIQCYHAKQDYKKGEELRTKIRDIYIKTDTDFLKKPHLIIIDIINLNQKVLIVKERINPFLKCGWPPLYSFKLYNKGIDQEPYLTFEYDEVQRHLIKLNPNNKESELINAYKENPTYLEMLNLIKELEKKK